MSGPTLKAPPRPDAAPRLESTNAVFRRLRAIEARDIDELDHVNNVVWVRFVVHLAHAHSEALGFNFEAEKRAGCVWVVRRHEIDYHRSAGAEAQLLEETWVSELRGARLVRHSRFFLGESGPLLVAARTVWAWVDLKTMRPQRVPRHVADRFTLVNQPPR